VWVRINGELGDDPVLHTAAFTYASDLTLLGATVVPHGVTIGSPQLMPASLDHTIWFHRPFRADRWWLYDQWSPSAQGGRGLSLARVFTEDGTLVATVAQEGLIRRRDR
jgi:acyl-CoA thioesterase-2